MAIQRTQHCEDRKRQMVWEKLQRQLDAFGLWIKHETIHDATFIEADPGSSKKPHGEGSMTRPQPRWNLG